MESSATAPDSASVDDLFEVTMRGYNRRQVEDFVAKARQHVENLTAELGGTRQQRDQLMRDLTMLQEELLNVRQQLDSRPAHEEISERMAQILRLAQEEADQERQKAQAEYEELLERAQTEAGEAVEQARAEAAELLASTRISAEQTLQAAQEQAEAVLRETQEKSEFAVGDATVRAQRLLGDAERRTTQIVEAQDERVSTLVAVHAEAVRRLAEILDVLGGVIDQEEVAGSLQDGIDPGPLPAAGTPLRPDQVEGLEAVADLDPEPQETEARDLSESMDPNARSELLPAAQSVTSFDADQEPEDDAAPEAWGPQGQDSSGASQTASSQAPTAPPGIPSVQSGTGSKIAPGDMDATMLISLTPERDEPERTGPEQKAPAPFLPGAPGLFQPATAATEVLRPDADGTVVRVPFSSPSPDPGGVHLPTDHSADTPTPPAG
jgi:peptidoglycan DL-endopeptidase CwlO